MGRLSFSWLRRTARLLSGKPRWRLFLGLGVGILVPLQLVRAAPETAASTPPASSPVVAPPVPLAAIQRFVDIFERVKTGYVVPVADDQLFDQALKGLLTGLDSYSDYLSAEEYAQLQAFTDGELGQVGLSVIRSGENWTVGDIVAQSPAARAGLQRGDQLTRINGRVIRTLPKQDIDQLLRGPRGSAVLLQVVSGNRPPRTVRLQRLNLEDNQVMVKTTDQGIVILQIAGFQSQTAGQVAQALQAAQARQQLAGIVLDLRDNPGGLLSSAVEIASMLIAQGTLVSTRGNADPEQRFTASGKAPYAAVPVAVLINRYSASAAEVLAAALQQNRQVRLYGEASYGKGSVQKLIPVANDRAIKLTVAYYYLPNDQRLEGQGLRPDVMLPAAADRPVADTGIDAAQQQVASGLAASLPMASRPALPSATPSSSEPRR